MDWLPRAQATAQATSQASPGKLYVEALQLLPAAALPTLAAGTVAQEASFFTSRF
eukprot:CAMPEP_0174847036 /NCGR_PEP_ID=MMETSP1114-20130205/12668_1 /TAXON_ID=312471 /ORGANISM="Neobodo designis, Strain CCAP 1951/1" /LENGTH=54 /DNA_ID=CAMNT_0016081307 /DNA_START=140 /DNA_END=304 /DNA_ORIENTATION=-